MDLQRFQVILNHEDPDLVTEGLNQFVDTVLRDHNAEASFGYYGRPLDLTAVLGSEFPAQPIGVLADYLKASPQAEELFVLWNVETRSELKSLSAAHMRCLSAVIHCSHSHRSSIVICRRILKDFISGIHEQLSQNNKPDDEVLLTHATLGLLLSMARVSDDIARDTFQKMQFASSTLHSLSASAHQSKLSYRPKKSRRPMTMNSRSIVVAFVCALFARRDYAITSQLLAPRSLFWALTEQLEHEVQDALKCLLAAIQIHIIDWTGLSSASRVACIDGLKTKLLACYTSSRSQTVSTTHDFLLNLLDGDKQELLMGGESIREQQQSNLPSILQALHPQQNLKHREFVTKILKKRPGYLSLCMSAIAHNWGDARCTLAYLNTLTYAIELLSKTPLASVQQYQGDEDSSVIDVNAQISRNVTELIPRGLGKKELTKLVLSDSLLLQRSALAFLCALLSRLRQVVPVEHAVSLGNAISAVLPEFQSILTIKSKFSPRAVDQNDVEGDPIEPGYYIYSLVLKVCLQYIEVVPSMIPTTFDVVKLIEDLPTSHARERSRMSGAEAAMYRLTVLCIEGLMSASSRFHWLGNYDDTRKMVVNVLVNSDWKSCVKRSPFGALLSLYACCGDELKPVVKQLLLRVCERSQLFQPANETLHGHLHQLAELEVWLTLAEQGNVQCLLVDMLFRIAYHFNSWLCSTASNALRAVTNTDDENEVLWFSPLITAGTLFSLLIFPESELPRNITSNLEQSPLRFLHKYMNGLWTDLIWAMNAVIPIAYKLSNDSRAIFRQLSTMNRHTDDLIDTIRRDGSRGQQVALNSLMRALNSQFEFSVEGDWTASDVTPYALESDATTTELPKVISVQAAFAETNAVVHIADLLSSLPEPRPVSLSVSAIVALLEGQKEDNNAMDDAILQLQNSTVAVLTSLTGATANSVAVIALQLLYLWETAMVKLVQGNGKHGKEVKLAALCTICADLVSDLVVAAQQLGCPELGHAIVASGLQRDLARSCFLRSDSAGVAATYLYCTLSHHITVPLLANGPQQTPFALAVSAAIEQALPSFLEELAASIPRFPNGLASDLCVEAPRVWFACNMGNVLWGIVCQALDATRQQQIIDALSLQDQTMLTESLHDAILADEELVQNLFRQSTGAARQILRSAIATEASAANRVKADLCKLIVVQQLNTSGMIWELADQSVRSSALSRCLLLDAVTATEESEPIALLVKQFCKVELSSPVQPQLMLELLDRVVSVGLNAEQTHDVAAWIVHHVSDSHSFLKKLETFEEFSLSTSQLLTGVVKGLLNKAASANQSANALDCVSTVLSLSSRILKHALQAGPNQVDQYSQHVFELLNGCRHLRLNLTAQQSAKLAKATTKLTKLCLKHIFQAPALCRILQHLCGWLYWDESLGGVIDINETGLLSPAHLYALLVNHSEFADVVSLPLNRADDPKYRTKYNVLELLLALIYMVHQRGVNVDLPLATELHWTALARIAQGYSGSMSSADRLVCRIFQAFELFGVHVSLEALHLCMANQPVEDSSTLHEDTFEWFFLRFDLPTVHNTISHFPVERCLLPPPLSWEPSGVVAQYDELIQSTGLIAADEELDQQQEIDDLSHSDTSSEAEDLPRGSDHGSEATDADEDDDEDDDDIINPQNSNVLVHRCSSTCSGIACPPNCYDPSFYLPMLQHVLIGSTIPGRRIAQSGLLSLVFIALSSSCPLTRACAFALLQQIQDIFTDQSSITDTSFKERPQLVLLVRFIRDSRGSDVKNVPLPLTSAIFLARAALILLNSSHELFGTYNKYLLSRPYLDTMDIPLYSSLFFSNDADRHGKDTLTCVRLTRDGLGSRGDHLNLCRKHVYTSVLMLLNWCNDGPTMQAAVDLLHRALRQPDAARYLLERCGLVKWLGGQCFPLLQETDNELRSAIGNRLSPRMLILLRTSLHVGYLLSSTFNQVFREVESCVFGLVHFVSRQQCSISADFYHQLISLLVDLSLFNSDQSKDGTASSSLLGCEALLFLSSQVVSVQCPRSDLLRLSLASVVASNCAHVRSSQGEFDGLVLIRQWLQSLRKQTTGESQHEITEPYVHPLHNAHGDIAATHGDGDTQFSHFPPLPTFSFRSDVVDAESNPSSRAWDVVQNLSWANTAATPIEHCGPYGMTAVVSRAIQHMVQSPNQINSLRMDSTILRSLMEELARFTLEFTGISTPNTSECPERTRTLLCLNIISHHDQVTTLKQVAMLEYCRAFVLICTQYFASVNQANTDSPFSRLLKVLNATVNQQMVESEQIDLAFASIELLSMRFLYDGTLSLLNELCDQVVVALEAKTNSRALQAELRSSGSFWLFDTTAFHAEDQKKASRSKRTSQPAVKTTKRQKKL